MAGCGRGGEAKRHGAGAAFKVVWIELIDGIKDKWRLTYVQFYHVVADFINWEIKPGQIYKNILH